MGREGVEEACDLAAAWRARKWARRARAQRMVLAGSDYHGVIRHEVIAGH